MFPSKCLLLFGICLRKGARIIKNISKFFENMLWNLNVCAILFNPSNEGKINASQTIYRSLKKIKQLLCDKKCAGTSTLTQVKKPTAYRSFFYANLKRGHILTTGQRALETTQTKCQIWNWILKLVVSFNNKWEMSWWVSNSKLILK